MKCLSNINPGALTSLVQTSAMVRQSKCECSSLRSNTLLIISQLRLQRHRCSEVRPQEGSNVGEGGQCLLISPSPSHIPLPQVANHDFCLDASSYPGSGVKAKIWQCYDGLEAQSFYFTGDNRIAVTGKGQCLDLTDGKKDNGNVLQTWQCIDYNTNQIWN